MSETPPLGKTGNSGSFVNSFVNSMNAPLPQPCLCLVTDRSVGDPKTLVYRVAQAVEGGVDLVQLREKDLPGGALLTLARSIEEAITGRAVLVINERIDVTLASAARGVQLGEEAVPVGLARRILGPEYIIGRSVHSVEGALTARSQGADFLVAGTMFATSSHPGAEPAGPALVRQITERCSLPVIGIGGIVPGNLRGVIDAGACGVAVISSILASPDPKTAAQELKQALSQAWAEAAPALRGESNPA